jgi:uncharacterized protein (DUF305 family)
MATHCRSTPSCFWVRVNAWFADCEITVRKVLTDNGSCQGSHAFADALGDIEHRLTYARLYRRTGCPSNGVKPTNALAALPRKGNWDIRYASAVPSLTARIAAALAAWSTALLLTSCHSSPSGDHAHTLPTDDKPVITGEPAAYNSADVTFANSMTAQEQQGIDISQLVPDRSTNSELVTFAAKTAAALQVDTEVLKALAAQWKEGEDKQPAAGAPSSTTGGIVDNATIANLDSLHGPKFDTLWLKSMIGLDQGAIEVANAEVANGKNVDATSLAKQIVKARHAEIGQMQQILAS